MRNAAWLLMVLFTATAASTFTLQQPGISDPLPPPPAGKTWKLVWHDEFDGTTLGPSKWVYRPDGKRRDGWWNQKTVGLDGHGHLVIHTIKEADSYLDGCITT